MKQADRRPTDILTCRVDLRRIVGENLNSGDQGPK